MMQKVGRVVLCVVACVGLAACQPQPSAASVASAEAHRVVFDGTDVRDAGLGGQDFALLGPNGQAVNLSQFKGKVVVLVFGYTHCPDVCPTNLLAYADALKQLGDRAGEVQVLFVSVDPERDTVQVMQRYAPAFNPTFIGLTADKAHQPNLDAVLRQYKIVVRKMASNVPGQYLVDHSTGTYLLDRQGKSAVYEPHSQSATELAHDIKILLD